MADELQTLAGVTNTYSYDFESSNAAPASGIANQHVSPLGTFSINVTDHGGTSRATFFGTLNNASTMTIAGVVYNILTASIATGVLTLTAVPPVAATTTYGVQNIKFFVPDPANVNSGTLTAPIIPPPTIGQAQTIPTFPPPTPPPIGTVPVGPLVGPAIANAAVPPSTAGFPLLRYQPPGSATVPTAASLFPAFTTTPYTGFPNQPPTGVPIVFSNIWTNPTKAGGVWTVVPPPSTATNPCVAVGLWGPPGPTGSGPGPPSNPNPPGAGLPHAFTVSDGYAEPAQRSGGAVLSLTDLGLVHQPVSPTHSRRKRMSARHAAGGSD